MRYKFTSAHEWLDEAVNNRSVSVTELLILIHTNVDSDQIQFQFESLMDRDGYFDDLDEVEDNEEEDEEELD